MNTFGDNAASGSILISGKGITSIKFKVSLQSDGRGTAWSITSTSSDGYSLGISLLETDLAVTNTVSNTTPSVGDNVTFTIVATNNGISNSTNTGVSFVLPSGYTFVSSSVPPGTTYDPATGIWTIGDLPNGASSTITIVATVTSTNNYTSTATISGDNSEPDYTNNVDDAVVAPTSLPVTFGNVQATFSGNDFIVSWKSLTENNNDHFEIEVSTDGKLFKKLTKLQSKAVNGNSTLAIDYMYKTDISNAIGFILPAIFGMGLIGMSRRKRIGLSVIIILLLVANISCNKNSTHVDKSIDTKVYVRIVQVDKDGTKSYSKIVQAVQN